MERNVKVNIFLLIVAVLAILFAIFALTNRSEPTVPVDTAEYERNLRMLNDTIKVLREDIVKYKAEIERIDLERKNIKRELEIIIRDNEKVDSELANGDWDTNIKFLTDFLSKKDSLGD